jgi:WD40 repeat protein
MSLQKHRFVFLAVTILILTLSYLANRYAALPSPYLQATIDVYQPVTHVVFSPNQQYLLAATAQTATRSPQLLLWALPERVLLAAIPQDHAIASVSMSPDSRIVALLDATDTLTLYALDRHTHLTQRDRMQACAAHMYDQYYLSRTTFSPHGAEIAVLCRDRTIRMYHYDTKQLSTITLESSGLGIAYSNQQPFLGVLELTNRVTIWNAFTRTLEHTVALQQPSLVGRSLVWCPQGTFIATQATDSLQEWQVHSSQLVGTERFETYREVQAIHQQCTHVATTVFEVLPNSGVVKNNTIQITFRHPEYPTAILLQGHQDTVQSVDFSTDGHAVVSGSDDGTIRLWTITPDSD